MMAIPACTSLSLTIRPQRISSHCALHRGWSRRPIPASEGITLPRHHQPVQSAALGRIPASLFAGTVSTMICVLVSVKPNVAEGKRGSVSVGRFRNLVTLCRDFDSAAPTSALAQKHEHGGFQPDIIKTDTQKLPNKQQNHGPNAVFSGKVRRRKERYRRADCGHRGWNLRHQR
jgi:hypothetical protein